MFAEFSEDYRRASAMTAEETAKLMEQRYEHFTYISRIDGIHHKIAHYPTYFPGCFFLGIIDLALGKEELMHTLKMPSVFADTYNRAAKKLGIPYLM